MSPALYQFQLYNNHFRLAAPVPNTFPSNFPGSACQSIITAKARRDVKPRDGRVIAEKGDVWKRPYFQYFKNQKYNIVTFLGLK